MPAWNLRGSFRVRDGGYGVFGAESMMQLGDVDKEFWKDVPRLPIRVQVQPVTRRAEETIMNDPSTN